MDYAIKLLQEHKKAIDRNVKHSNLMQKDITAASRELAKVSDIQKALRLLKIKNRR